MKKPEILSKLEAIENTRKSAWKKGVYNYAFDMIDALEPQKEYTLDNIKESLLNGAANWAQYSYGGGGLIYDCAIAEALCNPSELKRCKGGERQPNRRENWLDVEARALYQAYILIKKVMR